MLLQARGELQFSQGVSVSSLELSATVLVVQGQPTWEELPAQLLTICTMENYILGCEFLQDLKNQGLPPNPWFSCPGFSVERVVSGVLQCLGLAVTH